MKPRRATGRPKPVRLDSELVRRGLATSRAAARRAIEEGRVMVGGMRATRASAQVTSGGSIVVDEPHAAFVSRGGEKLDGALARLEVAVAGRRWLDAGASTGGFTDRLLQGGATSVIALDVGYGQLDWSLRRDPRVHVMERRNLRHLSLSDLPYRPDAAVADLSFISLRVVMPVLAGVVADDGDLVLMVKPQFEVGRELVGKGGVVRDPKLWSEAISGVVQAAERQGWGLVEATPSSLPGPAGNREFFVHLRRGAPGDRTAVERAVAAAGP